MAKSRKAAPNALGRSGKPEAIRAAGSGGTQTGRRQTASATDDISHDVLHGPAKSAIYAAVTRRLRSTA